MFVIDDIINAFAADNAAKAQERQAREAMNLQREIYGQQRADQSPYLNAGSTSLAQLLQMMQPGYDSSQLANDPGYQFRMAEGQKALERSAAARGGLNSGGFMKGLARYSQGVASDEFGNRFNRLSGIAGMGQTAAGQLGQFGNHYADSMSNLYGAVGNAQAAGAMGVGNNIAGGVQSLGNLALMGLSGGMGGGLGALGAAGGAAGAAGAGAGGMGAAGMLIPKQAGALGRGLR